MPKTMTENEVQEVISTAVPVDTYEYGSLDGDDYYTATLYRAKDGRHFRHIDSAGMTAGKTAHTATWLNEAEVKSWKEY